MNPTPTLGVFDSGVGGLTVLRALTRHLPHARYIYLGDTARLPYGSKSQSTVVRYAVSAAHFLLEQGAGMLVIACNTATALALPEIRRAVAPVPVVGVVEPGAEAAVGSDPSPRVLVLATAATVASHAYTDALAAHGVPAVEKACPLLVPLVEEGWIDHPVTREVVRIYLAEALAGQPPFTTVLLGCTHYPLLHEVLAQALADLQHPARIVDSAQATAQAVARQLPPSEQPPAAVSSPEITFFATDSVAKFARLGSRFLGRPLSPVELVDLGG